MPGGWSRGRGVTQHIEEIAAGDVAHVVFSGCCAPVDVGKIRDNIFSDLRRGRERLLQDKHKKE